MWTPAQQKAFRAALAAHQKWDGPIRTLEEMGQYAPAFVEHISTLRTMIDQMRHLAEIALRISTQTRAE